jgi:hypothetical protein
MQLSLLAIHADAPLDCVEQHALRQLVDEGGRILWVGNRQGWSDFRDNVLEKTKTHRAQWTESPDAEEFADILREISPFELDGDLRGVRVLPLQDEERSRFLLFNQNPHRVTFDFCLKDGNELREVALEKKVGAEDSFFQDTSGRYHMTMQAGELRALETLLPAEMAALKQNTYQPRAELSEEIPLESWDVVPSQNFVIRDEIEIESSSEVMYALPLGDYSRINPHFSGTLLFETSFDYKPAARERVLLDLGQVFYCAAVSVNGHDCGRRAWSPFLFDITKALREGENRLRVDVSNTLANQWAKPDVREHDFRFCRNMYLEKSAPFIVQSCHAGLYGPVKMQVFKEAE